MEKSLEELIRLSEEKRSLLTQIRADCGTQHENISSGNLDAMEYIINRREEYMRRIERVDAEFMASVDPREKLDLRDRAANTEEWERYERLNEEIRGLYVEILKEDKINTVAMENRMAESRSELKQVKDGQRLNQAYYAPFGENSRIDDTF